MITITFNNQGVAVVKKGRKVISKVYNRPVFWKAKNIENIQYNTKYPYSLAIKGMSRECESLEEVTYFIEKYCY